MLRTATLRLISIHVGIFKITGKEYTTHTMKIFWRLTQKRSKKNKKYDARNYHVNRHDTSRQMKIINMFVALRAERYLKFAGKINSVNGSITSRLL